MTAVNVDTCEEKNFCRVSRRNLEQVFEPACSFFESFKSWQDAYCWNSQNYFYIQYLKTWQTPSIIWGIKIVCFSVTRNCNYVSLNWKNLAKKVSRKFKTMRLVTCIGSMLKSFPIFLFISKVWKINYRTNIYWTTNINLIRFRTHLYLFNI